ncbi:hypothetical protein FSP39_025139, partial [Pinctada imbricata]
KDEEIMERGNWTGKLDFILSCIGYAVGLGNVWRFPYLCYRNGGGAFLVPYAIMLIIAGLPLFFFELNLGQFASEGPITVWKVKPLFMGIGWGMVSISGMVSMYYNVIIMYSIYYMFVSFVNLDDTLPWQTCGNSWNTDECRTEAYPDIENAYNETVKIDMLMSLKSMSCLNSTATFNKLSTQFNMTFNSFAQYYSNSTYLENYEACDIKFRTASEEYWTRYVLRLHEAEPDRLYDIGDVSLKNILCLLVAWVFIFFCLMKGVKSSGKVVYFTATFPYVVLVILLIRGVTLEGYMRGIDFYITPKWHLLKDPKVWGDAATQIFYSLGPAFGGLLTMSSYNKFKNNTFRDAMLVSFINCGTSVFAGFAVFSLLGHMSLVTNRPVEEVADSGPGLTFVAYPEGIAKLGDWAPIVAFLFFFMIFTLGLDSQFAMMETVISGFTDVFPRVLRPRKALFTFAMCMLGFVLGIPMVCKGGIYVLTLIDWYSGSYGLMIVCFVELIVISWFYGVNNFRRDVEMMIGRKPAIFWVYWYATWVVITPIAIAFIVIMAAVFYTPAYYDRHDGRYSFPPFAEGVGWMMVCLPLLLIIGTAIFQAVKYGGFIVIMAAVTYSPAYYTRFDGKYEFPPFAEGLGWMMVVLPLCLIVGGMIVQSIRKGGIMNAMKPDPTWGPALDSDRTGRYQPIHGQEFDDIQNGTTNMGYIPEKEKGGPYMVSGNSYNQKM